jgi:hypothetical protein
LGVLVGRGAGLADTAPPRAAPPASPPRSGASQRPWARGPRPSAAWRFALTGGLAGPRAWPTAHGAREPARRWALRGPPLAPSAGGRGSPAPRRRSAVGPPAGAPPTTPALVSATAALWPAREALGTPALAAWRGVEASPRRARGPAWPPKGPGWCPVGAGGGGWCRTKTVPRRRTHP